MKLCKITDGTTFEAEFTTEHPTTIPGTVALRFTESGEFISLVETFLKFAILEVTAAESEQFASIGLPVVRAGKEKRDMTKIVLKHLIELESEMNSGKNARAACLNHASARVGLIAPGRYFAELDIHVGGDLYFETEEGKTQTLQQFLDSIEWDSTNSHDIEMKTYMSQQIWYVGDEVNELDESLFVWPETHVASIDVIRAAQTKAKAARNISGIRKKGRKDLSSEDLKSRMQPWGLEHKPFTPDTPFAELGIYSEEFPEAKTISDVVSATLKRATSQDEWADESIVPLDSQLGCDVARYVAGYFPGSIVASIQSSYHTGVFIGDYSISLDVKLEHPSVQRVGVNFTNEDVPARPPTWRELLALPDIRLFMTSITFRDVRYGEDRSATYSLPGMYQEDIGQWCNTHDDGMLYHCTQTPDLFIIATEGVERETLERLARHRPGDQPDDIKEE